MSLSSMGRRRFTRCRLGLGALLALGLSGPLAAQSLVERVQGLYFPDGQGTWDCRTVGMDGGAVAIQGQELRGVESTCEMLNPFAVPGLDAMAFDLSCVGEGMQYDGGRVLIVPVDAGVAIVRDGAVSTWIRCP